MRCLVNVDLRCCDAAGVVNDDFSRYLTLRGLIERELLTYLYLGNTAIYVLLT